MSHYFQFTLLTDNQQLKENLSKLENTQDKQNRVLKEKSDEINKLQTGS
jgi:hypothetical protein